MTTRTYLRIYLLLQTCLFSMADVNLTIANYNNDSRTELVYDGITVHGFGEKYSLPLRDGVSVIGVDGIRAVFLVKTTDGFVTNSSNWRCTTEPSPDTWWPTSYNDSTWPDAKVIKDRDVPQEYQPAQWITAEQVNVDDEKKRPWVYCRGRYGDEPGVTVSGSSIAGHTGIHYDGTDQGDYTSPWTLLLPQHVNVVAVDSSEDALIVTSSDGSLDTPGEWRCSSFVTEDQDWTGVNFAAEGWLRPVIVDQDLPESLRDSGAQWITTDGANRTHQIYCRVAYTPDTSTAAVIDASIARLLSCVMFVVIKMFY